MINRTDARFALSKHCFRTHFEGARQTNSTDISGFTPQNLRNAYGFSEKATGDGIRIAVICAFDSTGLEYNMNTFCDFFGLEKPKLSVYVPNGTTETNSRNWLVESNLDTQWVHVFAPSAEILAVFSRDASVKSLLSAAKYAADELSADIVSMSFGTDESAQDDSLSAFMAERRCIFISSSGDVGGQVSFPSTSECCISVGGTNLKLSESGSRISEIAWQNGGGGSSRIFEIPPYQGRFFNIYEYTDGMRGTPDVSMSANFVPGAAVYISSLGGWMMVGGTSLSAACFSGICACIKQMNPEIATSKDMLAFLYSQAGTSGYEIPQYNFHDITLGRSGEYFAVEGWDFCTGLGSPVIKQLLL